MAGSWKQPGSASAPLDVPDGATVRVTKELMVFHVPKNSQGVQLHGMQGTVKANVTMYQGKALSVNLPFKVAFTEPVAFVAHLVRSPPQLHRLPLPA